MAFWDDAWNTAKTAANRVGAAVHEAAKAAQESPAVQVAAGVATGGLSVAAQYAYGKITGESNPVTRTVEQAVSDPLGFVGSVPGAIVSEAGGGIITTGVRIVAAGAGELLDDDTLRDVADGIGDVHQHLRDHPETAIALTAGVAAVAVGGSAGLKALEKPLQDLLGAALPDDIEKYPGATAPEHNPEVELTGSGPSRGQDMLSRIIAARESGGLTPTRSDGPVRLTRHTPTLPDRGWWDRFVDWIADLLGVD